jgi:hypothetical protein
MLKRLATIVAAALFGAILLSFGLVEWSISQQAPPHNREEPTPVQKNGNEKYNLREPLVIVAPSIQIFGSHDAQKRSGESPEKHQWYSFFLDHPTEWLLVLFNLCLVVFNGLLWWSTDGLWVIANRQSDDLKRSVAAAERQAKVSEDAFTKLERPYVYIFEISPFMFDRKAPLSGSSLVFIGYSVANYGKTPAIIKHASGILHSVDYRTATGPDFPLPFAYDHPLITSPIIATNEIRTNIRENVASSSVEFVLDEHNNPIPKATAYQDVFLWIIISYKGPFTDHHEISGCWRWDSADCRFIKHSEDNWEK